MLGAKTILFRLLFEYSPVTSFLCCVENPTRYLSSTSPKISEHGVIKVLNTFALKLDVVEVLGEM